MATKAKSRGNNKGKVPNAPSQVAGTNPIPKVVTGSGRVIEHFSQTMKQDRRDVNQGRFLKAYGEKGTVLHASEKAGMSTQCHHLWMKNDPTYPARFAASQQDFNDKLDAEIFRRGHDGIDDLQLYRGAPILVPGEDGKPKPLVKKVYSDGLLMFAAKGAMPHKYKENGTQINAVGAVQINLTPSEERL